MTKIISRKSKKLIKRIKTEVRSSGYFYELTMFDDYYPDGAPLSVGEAIELLIEILEHADYDERMKQE